MLRKLFVLLFSISLMAPLSHADSIDFPYYVGWVTTDGGTTLNDGYWVKWNEFGHQNPTTGWDGYWYKDPDGEALLFRELNNGALAEIEWSYSYDEGTDTWSWELDDAIFFKITATHIIYYGIYDLESSTAYLFDNPVRFPRTLKVGQGISFQASAGGVTIQENITLLRKDLTVSSVSVPGSADLTNCAILYFQFTEPGSIEHGLVTMAPGKGEVWSFFYENGGTEVGTDVRDIVSDWGTSGSYPTFMATDLPDVMSVLNGLTLSDSNIVDAETIGGNKVVVVPLMD
jgi:hypothetical protein